MNIESYLILHAFEMGRYVKLTRISDLNDIEAKARSPPCSYV